MPEPEAPLSPGLQPCKAPYAATLKEWISSLVAMKCSPPLRQPLDVVVIYSYTIDVLEIGRIAPLRQDDIFPMRALQKRFCAVV